MASYVRGAARLHTYAAPGATATRDVPRNGRSASGCPALSRGGLSVAGDRLHAGPLRSRRPISSAVSGPLVMPCCGSSKGLSEHDVRRPPTPTGTNLLGLLKHAAGVELGCFGETLGRPFGEVVPAFGDGAEANQGMWATAGVRGRGLGPRGSRFPCRTVRRGLWRGPPDVGVGAFSVR